MRLRTFELRTRGRPEEWARLAVVTHSVASDAAATPNWHFPSLSGMSGRPT